MRRRRNERGSDAHLDLDQEGIPCFAGSRGDGGGTLGGVTNALMIQVTLTEVLRHVAIGVAIVAGHGGLGAPLVGQGLAYPRRVERAPRGAAGRTVAYLTGSLGAVMG